ncbi:MAG: hypothetical protein FJ308_23185 [Planctomycetes bacterium]|nr:hypothetical protein [Planctomycetota bacterium]
MRIRTQTENPPAAVGRHRFSLRILLLVVTGFAILFAYLSYYRSTQASVDYTFLAVESTDLDSLALNLNDVLGSPYKWTHLDDSDVKTLLLGSRLVSADILQKQASVHSWPMQAHTSTWTRPVFLEVNDPRQGEHPAKLVEFESAAFGGFLGVRLAGRRLQFRVEAKVDYNRPDDDVEPKDMNHPMDRIQGTLFYEGQAPEHALMFAAPLDDHTYHVVLFTVKR